MLRRTVLFHGWDGSDRVSGAVGLGVGPFSLVVLEAKKKRATRKPPLSPMVRLLSLCL